MKLHIINYLFAVFYQELVSISTEGRTGCLSVLGNVKHKIVCSPDFEALLESSAWLLLMGWRGLSGRLLDGGLWCSAANKDQHPLWELWPLIVFVFRVAIKTYQQYKFILLRQHSHINAWMLCHMYWKVLFKILEKTVHGCKCVNKRVVIQVCWCHILSQITYSQIMTTLFLQNKSV